MTTLREQYRAWGERVHAELVDYGCGLGDLEQVIDLWDLFEIDADAKDVLVAAGWCIECLRVHDNIGALYCEDCDPPDGDA